MRTVTRDSPLHSDQKRSLPPGIAPRLGVGARELRQPALEHDDRAELARQVRVDVGAVAVRVEAALQVGRPSPGRASRPASVQSLITASEA